jgi:hypothetical protein
VHAHPHQLPVQRRRAGALTAGGDGRTEGRRGRIRGGPSISGVRRLQRELLRHVSRVRLSGEKAPSLWQ